MQLQVIQVYFDLQAFVKKRVAYYLIVNNESYVEDGHICAIACNSVSLLCSDHNSAMTDPEPKSSVNLTSDLLLSRSTHILWQYLLRMSYLTDVLRPTHKIFT